tara:strand:- start:18 stop:1181 length:1164 start_codon:yes stop_codon:yes gene_type:complete
MQDIKLKFIIKKFFNNSKIININLIDSGLINKTYLVEHVYDGSKSKFILQSLSNIFESKELVNSNHKLITDHIQKKINYSGFTFDQKRWEVPNLIRCKSNNLFYYPFESDFWRSMVYIDRTFSLYSLQDENIAYETGIGLAKFHSICSDLDSYKLEKSIKNFHNTKYYIDQYITTIKNYDFTKSDRNVNKRIIDLNAFIYKQIGYVDNLLNFLSTRLTNQNVIHGDPKLSNFLFDIKYKYVVSLIDLDSVSSGYLLTDLADCIRSICNLAGEDPSNIDSVSFDIKAFRYFLNGYLAISEKNINYSFIYLLEFVYLITFELTIRFLTDFLQSNIYFKIEYDTHNLYRAEVQYRLLYSFIIQMPVLSKELHEIGFSPCSTFVSDVQKFV